MPEKSINRWDTRYSQQEYVYGTEPNNYLAENLANYKPGTILFPADGEGRNSVYAAKLGWDAHAFDTSTEGRKKALKLAEENNVNIDYRIGYLPELDYKKEQFDAISLIYAHFHQDIRSGYHKILNGLLKPGGIIIFEGFSKKNLEYRKKNPRIGGPPVYDTLFSLQEIKNDFNNFEVLELVETEVELKEGEYHVGKGSVIRFLGVKKH